MGGTKRWLDVAPTDWFYRSVLEADRIFLDAKREETLFPEKIYNKFVSGKPRQVHNFVSTEGQTAFKISGYKPDSREDIIIYIDGVPTAPSALQTDWIRIGFPISAGKEVSISLSGVPDIHKGDPSPGNCQTYPLMDSCSLSYPSKKLEKSKFYIFDPKYALNEYCVSMNRKLKRVYVDIKPGEAIQAALRRTIGNKDDCFTILEGILYVSYNLNNFPALVNYNYKAGASIKNRQREKVVPTSKCVQYHDSFFPDHTVTRGEFFSLLERMRKNFYNRYTDRGYQSNGVAKTQRYIKDRSKIVGKWYAQDVLNILDEKFNDDCYVFPLYEDDSFQPEICVTKAEAVVYLNRFTEWALERFR